MSQLLIQLVVATVMVVITILIHGYGLALLVRVMAHLKLQSGLHEEGHHHVDLSNTAPVLFVVIALFALHGIEIWLYAFVYMALGAVPLLEEAVYFSTITYATIGYSDIHIDKAWRVLAGIEGIGGVILLGWSTAFFITVVARLRR